MKKAILVFLLATTAMPLQSMAAAGDFLLRARAITVNPGESSSLPLGVDNAVIPALDFTCFVTDNIALELILATSRHDVSLSGANIGKVSLLPCRSIRIRYRSASPGGRRSCQAPHRNISSAGPR